MTDPATAFFAGMFLVILIISPLIYKVVTFMFPLKVNPEATAFAGKYWLWKLNHVTGRVLATNAFTHTYGSGSVQGNAYTGTVSGSARVTTDVHETLRLQLPDGSQTNAEVVNYNVSAQPGDVISVWNVNKGGGFTVAVLNHTTNQQYVNDQDVFKILQRFQIVYILGMVFSILPMMLIIVFIGGGVWAFMLWFVFLVLYALLQKRVRRKFAKSGIAPMWQRSRNEAAPLLWSR